MMTRRPRLFFGQISVVLAALLVLGSIAMPASGHETMYSLYEKNRKEGVGNYITEDFILLNHSMMINEAAAWIEESLLAASFREFGRNMLSELEKKQDKDSVTTWNIRYFTLLDALLSGLKPEGADGLDDAVAKELGMILKAEGIAKSALMVHQIDYSRFKPRGRYTKNPAMENWFRAMTWAGSAYFPLKESKATGISAKDADRLTAQALEIAGVINAAPALAQQYEAIDTLLGSIFGRVEDLTWPLYVSFVDYADGQAGKNTLAATRKEMFSLVKKEKRIPVIFDGIVQVDQLEKGLGSGDVLCGMRLFPRRYSAESAVLQTMVYPQVGNYTKESKKLPFTALKSGQSVVKGFPRALELMALFGSTLAEKRLEQSGDQNYAGYDKAWQQARTELRNNSNLAINNSLIRHWLQFGRGDEARRLNTMLGYWTWGRYINVLYTKQSVTGMLKSMSLSPGRSSAWLEPAAELYLRLKNDMQVLYAAVPDEVAEVKSRLHDFLQVMDRLIHIADMETAGYQLEAADIDFLNALDMTLFALTGKKDHPIVVDVHTEPNSKKVVEEAVGFARVISHAHEDTVLRGALFSHYEFKHDMADRLDDEAWGTMLVSPCPAYFVGMEKIIGDQVYQCEQPQQQRSILIRYIDGTLPSPEDGEHLQVKTPADYEPGKGLEGFKLVKTMDNLPICHALATPAAIRQLVLDEYVLSIEADQENKLMVKPKS